MIKKNLRILLIHNSYTSQIIGGEDVVVRSDYDYLKSSTDVEFIKLLTITRVKFPIPFINSAPFSLYYFVKVILIIFFYKIQVVHAHNYLPNASVSIFYAAKLMFCKVFITSHNYRSWCVNGMFYRSNYGVCESCTKSKFPLGGILYKCIKGSYAKSFIAQLLININKFFQPSIFIDKYVVLSKFQYDKYVELGVKRSKIYLKGNLLNGLEKFSYKTKNIKKMPFYNYIFVGRIEEAKGVYELIQAWSKLPKKYNLIIIGDYLGDVGFKENINKITNIKMLGPQSRMCTLKYIADSDYLIQPSIWYETFGLTIQEAFFLNVPVIAFPIGTRRDFVVDQYNGFLVSGSLEKSIIKASHYTNYVELCKGAYQTYLDSAEKNCNSRLIDLYSE